MFPPFRFFLLSLLFAGLLPAQTLADASTIPRLAPGPHMGFIEGFDDLRTGPDGINRARIAHRLRKQAIKSGMTIGRAQFDWRDLETAPGVYDQEFLDSALRYAGRGGISVFVTFSTIDTEEATLPDYLTGPDGLPLGGSFSGPEITRRFHAFLDWFVPQLKDYNVFALALGNEVDSPISDGRIVASDAAQHYINAIAHAKPLDPDLAFTVTLSGWANRTLPAFTDQVVDAFDIVSFNYYCLNRRLKVNTEKGWRNNIKAWKETAGDKQIFIQELGCPVGFGHAADGPLADRQNRIGGSADLQARFFTYFANAFVRDPQLRAATVFQLFDWSPDLASSFGDMLRDEGVIATGNRLEEWLATSGMCRWSDGSCRLGWLAWSEGLGLLKAARQQ